MSETIIRICDDGRIMVEKDINGVKSFKQIDPNTLVDCINRSLMRGVVSSGLMPKNCIAFTAHDSGERDICLLHPENRSDVSYFGTVYKDFPLPRLVFGFCISKEGRIGSSRIGIIPNNDKLKPETKMFVYPFSNVSKFRLCTGNNTFPPVKSMHTLGSIPYYILSMPNNNDHFKPENNKQSLEMRDLFELLKDKPPEFYYSDILIPSGDTLQNFINNN